MTKRHERWDLVGYDSDPVPADQVDVHDVSRDFKQRGQVMSDAARMLKSYGNDENWIGKASEKFNEHADKRWSDLNKAASKYHDAAAALDSWADDVQTARDDTLEGVRAAELAEQQRASNQQNLLEGKTDPTDAEKDEQDARQRRYDNASGDLNDARNRVHRAVDQLGRDAKRTANRIKSASENFKDSWKDDIRDVLKFVVFVLGVIAVVIAVIVIALAIAVTFGAAGVFLGLALGTWALIGTGVSAIAAGLTYLQYTSGDASKGDVALAIVGAIPLPLGKAGLLISKVGTAGRLTRGAATAFRGAAAPFNATRRAVLDLLPGATSAASRQFIVRAADEFAVAGREAGEAATRAAARDFGALKSHPLTAIAGEELSLQLKQLQHLGNLGTTATKLEKGFMAGGMFVTGMAGGAGVVGMGSDAYQTVSSAIDYLKDLAPPVNLSLVPAGR